MRIIWRLWVPGCHVCLLVVVIACWPGMDTGAWAGTVRMQIRTSVNNRESPLDVSVTCTNQGNAGAHHAKVHLFVRGMHLTEALPTPMTAGESHTIRFNPAVWAEIPGRYPLVVRVDFRDANDYPFSALAATTFGYRHYETDDLVVIGRDLELVDRVGGLQLDVIHMGPESRQIDASLFLPGELSAVRKHQRLGLNTGFDEKRLVFDIHNRGARPGARYPVFCSLEYEEGGLHFTHMVRTLVSIDRRVNRFRQTRSVWLALAWVLALLAAALAVNRQGSKAPDGTNLSEATRKPGRGLTRCAFSRGKSP